MLNNGMKLQCLQDFILSIIQVYTCIIIIITFVFRCVHMLSWMSFFSFPFLQSDPFVEIAKAQEGGTYTVVYRSKPILKTLDPKCVCVHVRVCRVVCRGGGFPPPPPRISQAMH